MQTIDMQNRIMQFKQDKGFDCSKNSLPTQFCLLYGEVAEAWDALFKGEMDAVPYELADIAIYLMSIASILDIDLGKVIVEKMDINEKRIWRNHKKQEV